MSRLTVGQVIASRRNRSLASRVTSRLGLFTGCRGRDPRLCGVEVGRCTLVHKSAGVSLVTDVFLHGSTATELRHWNILDT